MKTKNSDLSKLAEVFKKIKTKKSAGKFLKDLLTDSEVKLLTQRIEIAKYLLSGLTYLETAEKMKVSTTTVSRVGRAIKYGAGGFEKVV